MTEPLFGFPRLVRAAQLISEAHPRAFEPMREVPQTDLTALIKRILAADPSEYGDIAAGLNLREATILVHSYARRLSPGQHDAITEVLIRQPTARQLGQAWMIFRTQPGLEPLRTGMRRLSRAIAEHEHARDETTAFLLRVWTAADVDKQLIDEVEAAKADLETWSSTLLPASLVVEKDGPLYHRMQGSALIYGSAELFSRYDKYEVAGWFSSVPEKRYDAAAVNYIQQMDNESWSLVIIEQCVRRHGLPAAGGAFWSRIDPAKRLAIQRLIAGRLIADFFEDVADPQGRFRFWRRYADHLISIAYPPNKERVLLHFRSFLVVEFRDLGNAGYVYPEKLRDRIGALVLGPGNHGSCKIPTVAMHRIIHNQHWQRNTREALDRNMT